MKKFSRSRRTANAGGAALVIGSAATGAVLAQQQAAGTPVNVKEDVLFFVEAGEPGTFDPAAKHDAWLKSVAGKLGVTSDKLQQAFTDASKDVGMPFAFPPFIGAPHAATFTLKIEPHFAAAARALGITEDQLKQEMRTKSLADIARARGIDLKVVRDAIKAQRVAELDKAIADGKLPANMADRLKSHLDTEIEHQMNMRVPDGESRGILHFERAIAIREP
jgi:hypothetical protein